MWWRSSSNAAQITDADILNFALNLEYLEAEYYTYATTGSGIPAGLLGNGSAPTTGGMMANLSAPIQAGLHARQLLSGCSVTVTACRDHMRAVPPYPTTVCRACL